MIHVRTTRTPVSNDPIPIAHGDVDNVYIFYTPDGKLVQSETYDEAYAKWLLTKETD